MNVLDLSDISLSEEITQILAADKFVRIEKIISTGQASGWYDQDENEFVCLLKGKAIIEYEDGKQINLAEGDTVLIPANIKHRVAYTSSDPACIWLCVFWRQS